MDKIILNSIEVILAIGLMYLIFRFWNRRIRLNYTIEKSNKAFPIFLSMQVLTMLVVIINGIDPQNLIYLEGLSMFGSGASDYWSTVGIELVGFSLIFILANVIGHVLFMSGFKSENGLYEEIKSDNWPVVLIASTLILAFGYLGSHFVLKSFIFDWISRNAVLIPLS